MASPRTSASTCARVSAHVPARATPRLLRPALALALSLSAPLAAQAWNSPPTAVAFANASGLMLSGHLFSPAGSAPQAGRPAVVMLHGCAGVFNSGGNISSIYREWADRLTAAGYTALLVDSFTPRSATNQCGNGAGVGVSEIFDRPQDAVAAAQYLSANRIALGINPARVGLLGWSHGASTVMSTLATTDPVNYSSASTLAAGSPFRVGVAFYPGAGLADPRCGYTSDNKIKGCWKSLSDSRWDSYVPIVFHHGDADTTTDLAKVVTRVGKAQSLAGGASLSLTTYAGAVHSFDDPNVGGGSCDAAQPANTPDACAKQAADAAVMGTLAQQLAP